MAVKIGNFTMGFEKPVQPQYVAGASCGNRYGAFSEKQMESKLQALHEAEKKAKRSSNDETYPRTILSDKNRRVKPYLLEDMFATEPILNAGITSWKNLIQETSFKIWSSNSETNKEIKRIMEETNFLEVWLEYNPLHFGIFGRYWTEYLWNSEDNTQIIGFNPLNPIYMDYIRELSTDKIVYDSWGIESGYRMDFEDGTTPKDFKPSQVFHTSLFKVNRGQLGLGFIEPVYMDTELKENVEQARSNEAYARAHRVPLVEFAPEGSMVKPSDDLKARAEAFARSLVDPDTEWAAYSGQEMKLHWMEPPKIDAEMLDQLLYSTKLQAAVLKIPVSILLRCRIDEGSGDLEDLLDFFEYDFKAFQKALKIREAVIDIIKRQNEKRETNKIPIDDIKIEYGQLSQKSIKEIIMRVMRMGKAGMLNPDDPDVSAWIKSKMGIPSVLGKKDGLPAEDSGGVVR